MENRDSTEDSKTKIWKTMTQPKTQQKTQSRTQICMFSVFFPHVRQISQVVPSKSQFCSQVSPFRFFRSDFLHVFLPRRLNKKSRFNRSVNRRLNPGLESACFPGFPDVQQISQVFPSKSDVAAKFPLFFFRYTTQQ